MVTLVFIERVDSGAEIVLIILRGVSKYNTNHCFDMIEILYSIRIPPRITKRRLNCCLESSQITHQQEVVLKLDR